MTDIVVEVKKGMVTGLYCDISDARFVVVDWDLLERADAEDQIGIEEAHENLAALSPATSIEYGRAISG